MEIVEHGALAVQQAQAAQKCVAEAEAWKERGGGEKEKRVKKKEEKTPHLYQAILT